MRLKLSVLFICLFVFLVNESSVAKLSKELEKMQAKWVNRVNKNAKSLTRLYLKQAVLITADDMVIGQGPIRRYVADNRRLYTQLESAKQQKLYEHSENKIIDLGTLFLEQDKVVTDSMRYVVAWRKVGDDWLRELEVILPVGTDHSLDSDLNTLRSSWVKYANSSNPDAMLKALFLYDAAYLNNSETSRGYAEIAERFDFMKSPAFHINLKALHVEKVNESTVIDIGNWLTSEFVGYYFILWKKDDNQSWKISLYFNF